MMFYKLRFLLIISAIVLVAITGLFIHLTKQHIDENSLRACYASLQPALNEFSENQLFAIRINVVNDWKEVENEEKNNLLDLLFQSKEIDCRKTENLNRSDIKIYLRRISNHKIESRLSFEKVPEQ